MMSNRSKTIYTGLTGHLRTRVWEHRNYDYQQSAAVMSLISFRVMFWKEARTMRLLSLILLLLTFLGFTSAPTVATQKNAGGAEQKTTPKTGAMTDQDIQAMRQDVARMKALVQQMQTNLAFVDTSQSPLKHQFQLEIEMWQTMIVEMDRRLDRASREPSQRR